jgi:cytochrome P450
MGRRVEPGLSFVMTPEQIANATGAIVELQCYVDKLTRRRATDPKDDLITALQAAEANGERLTHTETVTMIANLLAAGHDTPGSQIPCSTPVVLQHRDQFDDTLQDDARFTNETLPVAIGWALYAGNRTAVIRHPGRRGAIWLANP